jgi:YggT family protein
MGRPWWYDSYWEKGKKPRRGFQLPRRRLWVWGAVVLLSLILTVSSSGFSPSVLPFLRGFVSYICRVLALVIFVRVMLSWLMVGRHNLLIMLLDDVAEPILSPLRRIVPRLGIFDISPLIAIAILYVIPIILKAILA